MEKILVLLIIVVGFTVIGVKAFEDSRKDNKGKRKQDNPEHPAKNKGKGG